MTTSRQLAAGKLVATSGPVIKLLRAVPKSPNYDRLMIERKAAVFVPAEGERGAETTLNMIPMLFGKYPLAGYGCAFVHGPTITSPTNGADINVYGEPYNSQNLPVAWLKRFGAVCYYLRLTRTMVGATPTNDVYEKILAKTETSTTFTSLPMNEGTCSWQLDSFSYNRRLLSLSEETVTFTTHTR